MAIKRSAATQEGSAYDLPEASYDAELVEVGRRTPYGEMLRRYWHPIATAEEVIHAASFWLIVAAFFLMSVSGFGLIVHLVPLLTDRGISARNVALAASLVGCGGLMARIGIGYVVDIFFAASVARLDVRG
jgi:hypothetical protein